jgi:hypothetical protein
VGPQGVVGAAEQAEFDSEGVAIADDRAVEVLVIQGAEEPFDHAVGLRAPDSGADVTKQRVVAGERLGEGAAAEARAVVRSVCDRPPSGSGSDRSMPALPASTNRSPQCPTVADETPCRRAASASDNSAFNNANTTWICSSTVGLLDAIPDLELPDLLVAWRAWAWLRRVAGRAKPEYRDQLRIAGKPAGPR